MRHVVSIDRLPARGRGLSARSTLLSAAIAVVLAAALTPGVAAAQQARPSAKPTGLEEIIVTARKREEDVQSVPQSIEVLAGAGLEALGKVTFKDLQFEVPGFYMENYESRATIAMRGVGAQVPGNGASVASHINGIFQASTATSLSWLFDVERVEVLKGPQGTLYGRNSTGGTVNIITRRPGSEFDVGGKLEYGSEDTLRVSAAMDAPLAEDWALRLAGTVTRADGRITNVLTGKKIDGNEFAGGRLTLAGNVGAVDVELFGQVTNETGGVGELIPLDEDAKPVYGWDKSYYDLPEVPEGERDYTVLGLTLSGDLGNGYSWRAVTGYQDYDEPKSYLDVNPFPSPVQLTIAFPQYAEQFSQELQLAFQGDRLNWVMGALYMDNDEGETRRVDIVPVLEPALDSATDNSVKTLAVFGDLNYGLTDKLRLNVGLRYNRDEVRNRFDGRGPFDGQSFDLKSTQSEPTGRIGLDYTTDSGTMYYGSVAKGFQAGYNTVGFATDGTPEPAEVKPENLYAYEVGMKSTLPGDRGLFNLAAFYYDYKDMQVLVGGIPLLPDGTPDPDGVPFYTTLNAGQATIYGVEASLTGIRFGEHVGLDVNAGYLNATFDEYQSLDDFGDPVDYSGNTLPRAPEFQGAIAMNLDNFMLGNGEAALRLEYQYRDKAYDNASNLYELQSTTFLNAVLTYDLGEWQFSASGRNLTDEKYLAFYDGRFFAPPGNFRTWLVGVSYNFR